MEKNSGFYLSPMINRLTNCFQQCLIVQMECDNEWFEALRERVCFFRIDEFFRAIAFV